MITPPFFHNLFTSTGFPSFTFSLFNRKTHYKLKANVFMDAVICVSMLVKRHAQRLKHYSHFSRHMHEQNHN